MATKNIKGIVLAGGKGTRLYPLTISTSKHLLAVYDKPMIYYPISVLMLSDIKEILIITNPEHLEIYKKLLGDGSQFGISIEYKSQEEPGGLAEAFIIGEDFIGKDSVSLILGDNLFYGQDFVPKLLKASQNHGSTIFAYQVKNPNKFGVAEINSDNKVLHIEEKPKNPRSNLAITGLYYFDNKVVERAKHIKISSRGEKEIVDLIQTYLDDGELNAEILSRGFAWLDTGSYDSLQDAGQFIQTIENRQGLKVACLEEISFYKGWISREELFETGKKLEQTSYGKYLIKISETKKSATGVKESK